MKSKPAGSMDEYIAGFPEDIQERLQQVRQTIRKAAPQATEAIKYAIPTFVLNGKNLVHFAAFKHHIGFYATPTGTPLSSRSCPATNKAKALCNSLSMRNCHSP